jgi:hypothetical protein
MAVAIRMKMDITSFLGWGSGILGRSTDNAQALPADVLPVTGASLLFGDQFVPQTVTAQGNGREARIVLVDDMVNHNHTFCSVALRETSTLAPVLLGEGYLLVITHYTH